MRHHDDQDDDEKTDDAELNDPVDTFLAQEPFVETPGVDEAALEREKLLHPGPDAESIVEAVELFNEHHPFD
jgi:hypothetical protein